VGDHAFDLSSIRRIVVVGAGKAGAGMAAAVLEVLGPRLVAEKRVAGWVNVPADCARPLAPIQLHPARPAGVNEPTEAGVAGTNKILEIVASLGPDDLCLCLISGGGSALLPAPAEGVALADILAVTRHLSGAGANIEQLNAARKQLSRVKGGGLARACRAGRLAAIIISDVLGDPLDVIASGPTVPDSATPRDALAVLEKFRAAEAGVPPRVFEYLRRKSPDQPPPRCDVRNVVIGNNAAAVDAAGMEAERLGYSHAMISASRPEGAAEDVGRHLARLALRMRIQSGPDCLISGGEPTVALVDPSRRGKGGRNQQLALAAGLALDDPAGVVILSGGTDGEDGPTDAAGAWIDAEVLAAAGRRNLDAADHLRRNDAYHFFAPLDALIKTGPTNTNVCDLRVVVVDRVEQAAHR
jgi:glycerate-2-kinase